ncbi:MAG: hypothetical protein WCX48_12350 [Bacteroidales bacterium]|jgi:hypothetical protein
MDLEQLKYQMSVQQAFIDGKKIEYRRLGSEVGWVRDIDPDFLWHKYEYRVEVEPRVIYLREDKGQLSSFNWLDEDMAKSAGSPVLRFIEDLTYNDSKRI